MSVSLEIRGLAELKEALRNLPTELKGEATAIVMDAAQAAKDDIVSQYPEQSGALRKGVRVQVEAIGPHGVAAKVRSTAFHGWLYEHGTEARHYYSKRGVRHATGRMPGKPVFIPTLIRHRRAMYAKVAAIIQAHGLTVKTDEAA
jgi:hypothetical protein